MRESSPKSRCSLPLRKYPPPPAPGLDAPEMRASENPGKPSRGVKNTEQRGGRGGEGSPGQEEGLRDRERCWEPAGQGDDPGAGQRRRRAALISSRTPWLGPWRSGRATRLPSGERGAGLRAGATGPGWGALLRPRHSPAASDPNPPPGPRASAAKQNKLVPVSCCATQS